METITLEAHLLSKLAEGTRRMVGFNQYLGNNVWDIHIVNVPNWMEARLRYRGWIRTGPRTWTMHAIKTDKYVAVEGWMSYYRLNILHVDDSTGLLDQYEVEGS